MHEEESGAPVLRVYHWYVSLSTLLGLDYAYTVNNRVSRITERDASSDFATVTFAYDTRGRLTREERVDVADPSRSYDLTYVYDAGGNRRVKIDAVNNREVQYHYDIDDPVTYGSNNNRLMFSDTFDTSVSPAVLVETAWYYYTPAGNVERVLTSGDNADPDEPEFQGVRLGYAGNGQAVTFVLGETWNTDALGNPIDYTVTFVREFRYDGARARYLNRALDPVAVISGDFTTFLSETWSDYEFDTIYGDYAVTDRVATNVRSYEPGLGNVDPWSGSDGTFGRYAHDDTLGTLRQSTNASATQDILRVFSAFGRPVAGPRDRFSYVAALGYQTHDEFPYLHLGARYYDPQAGRFLQRDPIGIDGGLNVYEYAQSAPTLFVDPEGTAIWAWVAGILRAIWEVGKRIRVKPAYHPKPHNFGRLGRRHHLECIFYLKGVKGSHFKIRIPLPGKGS